MGSKPPIAARLVDGRYHGERPFAALRYDVSHADLADVDEIVRKPKLMASPF